MSACQAVSVLGNVRCSFDAPHGLVRSPEGQLHDHGNEAQGVWFSQVGGGEPHRERGVLVVEGWSEPLEQLRPATPADQERNEQ